MNKKFIMGKQCNKLYLNGKMLWQVMNAVRINKHKKLSKKDIKGSNTKMMS